MLRRLGVPEVEVLERHKTIRNKACAGGISPRAIGLLKRLEMLGPLPQCASTINCARVVPPFGDAQCVSGAELALVLPRSAFDHHLVEQALAAGARLSRGIRVDRLIRQGVTVVGVGHGETELEADLVVLASGARNHLSWDPRPRQRLDGAVLRYEGSSAPPNQVQLAFHRELLPHYAWLFPEPEGIVNVGLCREHSPKQPPITAQLDRIAEEVFPDLARARPLGKVKGHPIVFSSKARYLTAPGAVAVGEAARLTDGFTGEGIWHALRSGLEAAKAICQGDVSAYQKRSYWAFDPVLGAAGAFKRFARTPWFGKLISWSSARPVNLFLLKSLTGLTS